MQRISSPENQKIKYACQLKKRKYRNREKAFLIEGPKMLEEALGSGQLPLQVFMEETREEEYRELSEAYKEIEWLVCGRKLISMMSDTESPQGVVAVVSMPQWSITEIAFSQAFFLLLDRISDPGNLGTIIRTGWALGVDALLLTPECVDPYSPKVVRSSMGGIFHLPVFCNFNKEKLLTLKQQGFAFLCSSLEAAESCYTLDFSGPKLIVIGSEARGVSQEIKSCCDKLFKIPIKPEVDSLNAAVACAIIINEAWKQKNGSFL